MCRAVHPALHFTFQWTGLSWRKNLRNRQFPERCSNWNSKVTARATLVTFQGICSLLQPDLLSALKWSDSSFRTVEPFSLSVQYHVRSIYMHSSRLRFDLKLVWCHKIGQSLKNSTQVISTQPKPKHAQRQRSSQAVYYAVRMVGSGSERVLNQEPDLFSPLLGRQHFKSMFDASFCILSLHRYWCNSWYSKTLFMMWF